MWIFSFNLVFLLSFLISRCLGSQKLASMKSFVFWPNATVPFYINPNHFDNEQSLAIMTTLSTFAFKTCIKFAPVMAAPSGDQHVMAFVNPDGIKRCKMQTQGHSNFSPHIINLGYECLQSPELDMMLMRALGFPFEHNRMSRDVFVEVMTQNIEPSYMHLYTKDDALPAPLRALPYDVNSVMHFGERDYSKNGHRTIIFKNKDIHQNRKGLSATDLRKIELVYGPECRQRDRQEKIELCQSYPGVARKKREIDPIAYKNLRVNRDITPPPFIELHKQTANEEKNKEVTARLKKLSIDNETEEIIDKIYKLSAVALEHAREKYCNKTNVTIEKIERTCRSDKADLLSIIETITEYTEDVVENALKNLTAFCQTPDSVAVYQRQQCKWEFGNRCPVIYRSTKTGPVGYSTQHRPIKIQSTRHEGVVNKYSYDKPMFRQRESEATTEPVTPASTSVGEVTLTTENFNDTQKSTKIGTVGPPYFSTTHDGGKHLSRIYDEDTDVTTPKSRIKREVNSESTPTLAKTTVKEQATKVTTDTVKPVEKNEKEVTQKSVDKELAEKNDKKELAEKIDKKELAEKNVKKELAENKDKIEVTKVKKARKTSPTTIKLKSNATVKKHKKRRQFQEHRYKVKEQKDVPDADWEESSISAESPQPKEKSNIKIKVKKEKRSKAEKKRIRDVQRGRVVKEFEYDIGKVDVKLQPGEQTEIGIKDVEKPIVFAESKEIVKIENVTEKVDKLEEVKPVKLVSAETEGAQGLIREKSQEFQREIELKSDKVEEVTVKLPKKRKRKLKVKVDSIEKEDVSVLNLAVGEPLQGEWSDKKQNRMKSRTNDIIPKTVRLSKPNEEFYEERKWPDGQVVYVIKDLVQYDVEDLRNRLEEVNNILLRKTCVKLREVAEDEAEGFEDYLVLDNSPDYVTGKVGGKQIFGSAELFQGGQHRQHTAMMVMAMLGFYFEVSRHDRDTYIRVHNRHIRPDKLHHFEKIRDEATLELPYDYKSATHPAWQFWRKIGRTGISTVATYKENDPDGSIMRSLGQNEQLLSDIDIIKINSIYGVDCFEEEARKRAKEIN